MRILLVICCIFFICSIYSQTKMDSLSNDIPILKINRKEPIYTYYSPSTERKKDSFPRTIVQETYYEGRKIQVITEYTSP